MKPQIFFDMLRPHTTEGSDVPAAFILAQGALESAWGESKLAKFGMNLFGVKADGSWSGATMSIPTREFIRGEMSVVNAKWRRYNNWSECINDHANFLRNNPRYAAAFTPPHSESPEGFAKAVADAGYATDPQYANKIISIIRKYRLA